MTSAKSSFSCQKIKIKQVPTHACSSTKHKQQCCHHSEQDVDPSRLPSLVVAVAVAVVVVVLWQFSSNVQGVHDALQRYRQQTIRTGRRGFVYVHVCDIRHLLLLMLLLTCVFCGCWEGYFTWQAIAQHQHELNSARRKERRLARQAAAKARAASRLQAMREAREAERRASEKRAANVRCTGVDKVHASGWSLPDSQFACTFTHRLACRCVAGG